MLLLNEAQLLIFPFVLGAILFLRLWLQGVTFHYFCAQGMALRQGAHTYLGVLG